MEYLIYKKNIFTRIFWLNGYINRKNSQLSKEYEVELKTWESIKKSFLKKKKEYLKLVLDAQTGNISSMEKVFINVLGLIKWEKETNISFDIEDNNTSIKIDVDLPEIEDLPTHEAARESRGLKINIKKKSKVMIKRNYHQCVFSTIFRVIGNTYTTLPIVNTVIVSGYTQRTNPKTGHLEDDYIISIYTNRIKWESMNFDNLNNIDPSLALGEFELICDLDRGEGFKSIHPF